MKDYTTTEPVFSESISIVEENDLVNAENNNAAPKQLLQNILAMRAMMVTKEEGKSLVSDEEKNFWNMIYQQATGYTDLKIADLINGAPSTLDTLGEIAAAMGDNADVVAALNAAIGTKANQAEMESLLGTKLDKTGDTKDNVVTFTSSDTTTPSGWTDVGVLQSGETHKSFLQKVSTMFRNVRYLWKLCGNSDISKLGDGTITGALNSLNTGLADLSKTSSTSISWNGISIGIYRKGYTVRVKTIAGTLTNVMNNYATYILGTIPNGFRPAEERTKIIILKENATAKLHISTDGVISVTTHAGSIAVGYTPLIDDVYWIK